MLLDRIDIDSHGPLARVTLGPFSQTLNAVVAASGSGKTALVRFLRDSLTGTTPTREGLSQSIGRVVWSAADGFYHCRRQPNGTAQGHRFVEFESRLAQSMSGSRFAKDAIVVDLPASVVDGIVTDTVLTSVQHCIQAAIASGLDHHSTAVNSSRDIEIAQLRREIVELERQIHSHTLHSQHASARSSGAYESFGLTLDMKRLRDRRAELSLEISAIDARRDWTAKADAEVERRRRKRELFATVTDEIERLRRQESDLRVRLGEVESSLQQMDDDDSRAESRESIARAYRAKLDQIDNQLGRVRQVVQEIRALGDLWFGGDRDSRVMNRSDEFVDLNIVDRGWSANLVDAMRIDDSVASNPIDVQFRIDAICRLVDNLVGRCEEHHDETAYADLDRNEIANRHETEGPWSEAELDLHERRRGSHAPSTSADPADSGERFEAIGSLDRAERLLQAERDFRANSVNHSNESIAWIAGVLNGVSQRLRGLAGRHAQYGSRNVDPLFHARHDDDRLVDYTHPSLSLDPQAQVAAIRRCERELVDVMRQLVARRDVMLRRVAEVQNQPLSQVASTINDSHALDDPQLYQWLVRDRITASDRDAKQRNATRQRFTQQRAGLATDLKRTTSRITDRLAEAETIRMYLRTLPVVHRYDDDAQLRARLVAEIRAIDEQLARPRVNPATLERHAQCVTRLRTLTSQGPEVAGLASAATDYLQKLSGGRMRTLSWQRDVDRVVPLNVEIDGRGEAGCDPVEKFIAALAVRLAAADELARRGRALPVIIETPSLRHLSSTGANAEARSLMQSAIETLSEYTKRGRQVIVLTDDAVVADAVMRAGGSVQSIRGNRIAINESPKERMFDINRDFDVAWREANGDDSIYRPDERRSVERPAEEIQDTARNFVMPQTIRSRFDLPVAINSDEGRVEATDLSFFLTGLSPIEQAPSINASQAARLRTVGVSCIDHLLAASPKELAGTLQLADVDAAAVRRWQYESRLVCGVRNLRGFDARVLVGCGITHPRELSELEPRTLVERIETFLETDRGRSILRSGSDQEISRLRDWINQVRSRASVRTSAPPTTPNPHEGRARSAGEVNPSARFADAQRSRQSRREAKPTPREYRPRQEEKLVRREPRRQEPSDTVLRFYLQRSNDVEAAPSIGPRMAERLHHIGIKTVDDLVTRSASSIADQLKLSKVDAELVQQWQQQATLVCCVPELRGHDAQLLVAAGITEPERLAAYEPGGLLRKIEPIAHSREGRSILRGGKYPDLAEMQEWIGNAQQHRALVAA